MCQTAKPPIRSLIFAITPNNNVFSGLKSPGASSISANSQPLFPMLEIPFMKRYILHI